MKSRLLYKVISGIGLLLTVVPSAFVFYNLMDLGLNKTIMALGTLIWFSIAPFWMNKEKS